MYDMPHARGAHDRFWALIRDELRFGPDALLRDEDIWTHWLSPDLLVSQTCGLPFRARLHDKVTLVGTPDYGLAGCPPGYYNSVLVVSAQSGADDLSHLQTPRLAYNDALSQSGWAAPFAHLKAHAVEFMPGPQTGSHAASAQTVADAEADIAALDALTWTMLQRENPQLAQALKVIAHTAPTPGLPYITALGQDPEPLAQAIDRAIARLTETDVSVLHIKGLVRIPVETYLALPIPPAPASPSQGLPKN